MLVSQFGFAPVGQGLFSFGTVGSFRRQESFRWVYDCGTVSKRYHLANAIDRLRSLWDDGSHRPRIDLVAISHFDQDHVNGLEALLTKFDVRRLLIPYLPLWQRVASQAHQTKYQSHAARQLALDPVATIAAWPSRPRELLLVPGASRERPAEPPLPPGGDPQRPNRDLGELLVDYWDEGREQADAELWGEIAGGATGAGMQVQVLQPGGRLWLPNTWEFVPYNDATLAQVPTATFLAQVAAQRSKLLHAASEAQRKRALARLITAYDREFGSQAGPRNRISLFVYAGTLLPYVTLLEGVQISKRKIDRWAEEWWPLRAGVIYTGDGYLDNAPRLQELASYLGQPRLDAATCLQVMHHGAQGNWCADVAPVIQPRFSVFSSDPKHRHGHPHAKVKRAFRDHGPMFTTMKSEVNLTIFGWCP